MKEKHYGFLLRSPNEQVNLSSEDIGNLVETDITPWFIYHNIALLPITEWPVELWFVEVVRSFSTASQHYIPAIAIKPLKQLSCSLLFGSQGEGICLLLDKFSQLTLSQIERLAEFNNPISAGVYANVWHNWLQQMPHLAMHYEADHSTTLAIGEGEDASPINSGLLAVNDLLYQRAKALMGKEASNQSMEEIYTLPLWRNACCVLLQIAMGLGAERYIAQKELPLLLLGWEALQ